MAKITQIPTLICIGLIYLYRYLLSPFLGQRCRFYPSCSCYAQQALATHGFFYGLWLTIKRLLCCHPWHPGGYDPIPTKKAAHFKKESNTL